MLKLKQDEKEKYEKYYSNGELRIIYAYRDDDAGKIRYWIGESLEDVRAQRDRWLSSQSEKKEEVPTHRERAWGISNAARYGGVSGNENQ